MDSFLVVEPFVGRPDARESLACRHRFIHVGSQAAGFHLDEFVEYGCAVYKYFSQQLPAEESTPTCRQEFLANNITQIFIQGRN